MIDILKTKVMGLEFSSPLGLAAGYDKNIEMADSLSRLDFGFIEFGTLTPKAQKGNPDGKVSITYNEYEAPIIHNNLGLNNCGFKPAMERLKAIKDRKQIIGISIGANTDSINNDSENNNAVNTVRDYRLGSRVFSELADYVVLNLSCPNIDKKGIFGRDDNYDFIKNMIRVSHRIKRRGVPLLIKLPLALDPDYDLQNIVRRIQYHNAVRSGIYYESLINGIILTNSFPTEKGGQTGPGSSIFEMSGSSLINVYNSLTDSGDDIIKLIGVGGITSAKDAYEKIGLGASLIQIHSALLIKGTDVVKEISEGLAEILVKEGHKSVNDAVGCGIAPKIGNWW